MSGRHFKSRFEWSVVEPARGNGETGLLTSKSKPQRIYRPPYTRIHLLLRAQCLDTPINLTYDVRSKQSDR